MAQGAVIDVQDARPGNKGAGAAGVRACGRRGRCGRWARACGTQLADGQLESGARRLRMTPAAFRGAGGDSRAAPPTRRLSPTRSQFRLPVLNILRGQKSGLCIGRGQKSALCIGFGRKSVPFPPRRDAPARTLSQKASSRARLRFEAPQGDFCPILPRGGLHATSQRR